jgi:hypothetical protein
LGLGFCPKPQNPQSPIPNPQLNNKSFINKIINIKNNKYNNNNIPKNYNKINKLI